MYFSEGCLDQYFVLCLTIDCQSEITANMGSLSTLLGGTSTQFNSYISKISFTSSDFTSGGNIGYFKSYLCRPDSSAPQRKCRLNMNLDNAFSVTSLYLVQFVGENTVSSIAI